MLGGTRNLVLRRSFVVTLFLRHLLLMSARLAVHVGR
jgi:hypothetical protein